jgi:uncharacterized membrane protein
MSHAIPGTRTTAPTGTGLGLLGVGLIVVGLAARSTRRTKARISGVAMALGALLGAKAFFASTKRSTARARAGRPLRRAITVSVPADRVYRFWRDLRNLPFLMERLESVEVLDAARSRWRASGQTGDTVEWEAQIVEDRENELIRWTSLPGAEVAHRGEVRFCAAPGGRATEVSVEVEHVPSDGQQALAAEVESGLRRLKQIIETGEVVHHHVPAAARNAATGNLLSSAQPA